MSKKESILALMLVICLVLSGCGGSSKGGDSKSDIPSYKLYLDIAFEGNLLFDKYDVDVCFDEEKLDTIPHGTYYTKMLESVDEGSHSILFHKNGDESVKGEYEVKVKGDTTFKCTIHAKGSEVKIDEIQTIDSIEGNAIQMIDAVGMNLEEARKSLTELGFVNVTSEAKDDVIFVDSNWTVVSQNIAAGTECDKNTEIVLTCEYNIEENPAVGDTTEDAKTGTTETEKSDTARTETADTEKTDTADESKSIYDLAYKIVNDEYSVYYLIDTDDHQICTFATHDTSIQRAPYTGNLDDGIDIDYGEGGHELLKNKEPGNDEIVLITPGSDTKFEYAAEFSKTTVEEAERALNRLTGDSGSEKDTVKQSSDVKTTTSQMENKESEKKKTEEQIKSTETPSLTISDLEVGWQMDYGHVSTETIILGNDEGATVTIKAPKKGVTTDDLFYVYDDQMVNVNEKDSTDNSGNHCVELYITGLAEGNTDFCIVVEEEYDKLGDNTPVLPISVRKLDSTEGRVVYYTPTGEKYHFSADCAGPNARKTTLHDVAALEVEPCGNCAQ